jgi:hypothetical protein
MVYKKPPNSRGIGHSVPTVSAFISKLSLNFLENLHVSSEAVHFSVGRRTVNRRLRARLPQDIL